MKQKIYSLALALCSLSIAVTATADDKVLSTKYTRSSIYSILVNHTEQKYAKEIRSQFLNIPTPDQ